MSLGLKVFFRLGIPKEEEHRHPRYREGVADFDPEAYSMTTEAPGSKGLVRQAREKR